MEILAKTGKGVWPHQLAKIDIEFVWLQETTITIEQRNMVGTKIVTKAYFDQGLEWAGPKLWSKYTTPHCIRFCDNWDNYCNEIYFFECINPKAAYVIFAMECVISNSAHTF